MSELPDAAQRQPVLPATLVTAGESDPAATEARSQLKFLLQLAYSGELAATRAYLGHRYSLKDAVERAEVGKIAREKWDLPPPREDIRIAFEQFNQGHEQRLARVRVPLFIR